MFPAGTATEIIAGNQYGPTFETGLIELKVLIEASVRLVPGVKA
jgi:hypothetical protein